MRKELNAPKNASKLPRIIAYAIDYLIILLVTSVAGFYSINIKLGLNFIVLNELPTDYRLMYDIIAAVVAIVFIVLVPLFNRGRSIGKTLMHLSLVNSDDTPILRRKILTRQGLVIFIFGGILNPNHTYFIDLLVQNINEYFKYFQVMVNTLSIFCCFMFIFSKGSNTIYDKYLNININNQWHKE